MWKYHGGLGLRAALHFRFRLAQKLFQNNLQNEAQWYWNILNNGVSVVLRCFQDYFCLVSLQGPGGFGSCSQTKQERGWRARRKIYQNNCAFCLWAMKDIDSTQVFRTKTWYFTSRWAPNLSKATLTSSGIPHKLCGESVLVLGGYPKSILICRVWIVPTFTFTWLYSIDSCEYPGQKHHSHTLSQKYNQLRYDIHQCGCFLKWWYP